VILLGLILMLYASVIKGLVEQWWTDADYGYGFFVPLFSGYILWHERERWTKTEIKPSNFGFVIMLGAVSLFLLGSLGAELFTSRFSLLVLLFPLGLPDVDDSRSRDHLQSDHISIAIDCVPLCFGLARASPCTGLARW
jgi:hypothetical protein